MATKEDEALQRATLDEIERRIKPASGLRLEACIMVFTDRAGNTQSIELLDAHHASVLEAVRDIVDGWNKAENQKTKD